MLLEEEDLLFPLCISCSEGGCQERSKLNEPTVSLTYTLTEKRELNAQKTGMQLRIKKNRARQKIARARTTLRHQPH